MVPELLFPSVFCLLFWVLYWSNNWHEFCFFGGKVDLLVQRFIDLMLSFPIIVLAIIVIAVFPKSVVLGVDVNVIVAIAIPFIPKTARVIRSQALAVVTLPYVDAARTNGFSSTRIIFRHILPNVTAPF